MGWLDALRDPEHDPRQGRYIYSYADTAKIKSSPHTAQELADAPDEDD